MYTSPAPVTSIFVIGPTFVYIHGKPGTLLFIAHGCWALDVEVTMISATAEAYASVSGSAISGGTASEYEVEQISNMASGGYRERFSPLVDRVPTGFFG